MFSGMILLLAIFIFMIRILSVIPLPFDATSYYRAYGVFPNLKEQLGGNLSWEPYGSHGRKYTWAELSGYDILFLQRPGNPENLKLIKYCKDLGLKIWIDHDDNLFQLPPYNRVHDEYTPEVKKAMLEMVKLADVLTVSTEALRQFFATVGVVAEVVPNALNEKLTPMATAYNETLPDNPDQFVWRGSETHHGDLYFHQEQIIKAIEERPNTFWHFVGYNPWQITLFVDQKKYKYHKPDDIMVYTQNLKSLKAQVMHVPLVDDPLNQCKSNIAWIEATAAGMVTIGPDWHEWRKPGVMLYDSVDFYGQRLMMPEDNYKLRWKASRDYIMENLTLDKVNQKRVDIVERLMSRKFYGNNLPPTMIE